VLLNGVAAKFGDKWQANYDDAHASLFADSSAGSMLRGALRAEHAMLYRKGLRPNWMRVGEPRTMTTWISTGTEFIQLLDHGMRNGVRRVYTYSLLDSGLFFSETGVAMSKDVVSKHAVHANAAVQVRFAGTFRFVSDGEPICVIDNDSGTYRPDGGDFDLLRRVFDANFPGLRLCCLNVTEDQPEEMKTFLGPCEVENADNVERVYAGRWVWNFLSQRAP